MKTFSLWCDFIENHFLDNEFLALLNEGLINGATSNPAIFKNAILSSDAYKKAIACFKGADKTKLYEELIIKDIRKAADKLALNYFQKNDGFISVEINPHLAEDENATIAEGLRLFSKISRQNVMIKLPATKASYKAMSVLLANGINVNATLVFDTTQVASCLDAMNEGYKLFDKNPISKQRPSAVISVFVSRFDKEINKKSVIKNQAGILNATIAYNMIQANANKSIRTLFASTGVKEEGLKKAYYIEELLYPHSINTAPLDAIHAFKRVLHPQSKMAKSTAKCQEELRSIISKEDLCKLSNKLLVQGLSQFKEAYDEIITSL